MAFSLSTFGLNGRCMTMDLSLRDVEYGLSDAPPSFFTADALRLRLDPLGIPGLGGDLTETVCAASASNVVVSQEGRVIFEGDALKGAIKSERGELAIEGTRKGAPLIGTWDLELTSDRGSRKQRLRVNPDMSARYGAMPVEKVGFEEGKVTFKIVLEFGERKFEMEFQGKIEESKLAGEITSSRGTQKVAGTKLVRRFRRHRIRFGDKGGFAFDQAHRAGHSY